MSDPAQTPDEIEDVLASIRRLVSDTSAPSADKKPLADEAVGRLVLTPSFRISDDAKEADVAPSGAANGAHWQPDDLMADFDTVGPDAALDTDATMETDGAQDIDGAPLADDADAEDVSGASDADPDTDPAEEQVTADPASDATPAQPDPVLDTEDAPGVAEVLPADLLALQEDAEFESETGDDNWPDDGPQTALQALAAHRDGTGDGATADDADIVDRLMSDDADDIATQDEADITDDAAAAPDLSDEDPVADVIDPAAAIVTPVFSRRAAREPAPETHNGPVIAQDDGDTVPPAEVIDTATTSATAEAPIPTEAEGQGEADLNDAGDSAVDAAPVDDETTETDDAVTVELEEVADAYSEDSDAFSDDVRDAEDADDASEMYGDAEEAALDAVPPEAGSLFAALTDEADTLLDEETLREIVADVVREELRGALGQRITRNVRKMVRREIRLALAAERLQ